MNSHASRPRIETNQTDPTAGPVAHAGMRKEVIVVMPGLVLATLLSTLD